MGYKIVYVRKRRRWRRFAVLISACFLLFVYAVSGGRRLDALEELAQRLGAGVDIGEAVSAFCQDVLHGQ